VKAELQSGEIVTLAKECECVTHNDPHWVYMDRLDRERNRELLKPRDGAERPSLLALRGFLQEDLIRIREKRRNFERLGIVRIMREPSDELTDIQRETNRRFGESYAKELQARIDARRPKPTEAPTEKTKRVRREQRDRKEDVEIEARRRL
jgi:hypothetical protein